MKNFAIAAATTFATCASAGAAVHASRVCVANMGGYDLNWWIDDLITGDESNNSGSYPIDQMRCNDIANYGLYGLAEGDFLNVMVHAVLGVTKSADTAVIFQSEPAFTVTFTCRGTTLNFECKLN